MLGKGKEAKKPKKEKKPKPTPQEKAIKEKAKIEKAAAAKIKKAEAKVKKAEQAVKNKEKKAEAKIKKEAQKEANAVKKLEKKEQKAEARAEKKALAKIRAAEIKDEKRARKMQKRAELAARTPLQKKVDRKRFIRRTAIVVLVVALLSGIVFAGVKTAPLIAEKLNIPKFNIAQKIPFLKEKKEEKKKEKDEKAEKDKEKEDGGKDEKKDPAAPEEPKDDATLFVGGSSVLNEYYTKALGKYLKLDKEALKNQSVKLSNDQAYTNLINGDCQVIFAAFPTDKETRMASMSGKTLNPIPILNGGFVFFTNKANPVKNLTQTQLYNIYTGTITNWKELGGNDEPIVAYQRTGNAAAQIEMYREVVSEAEIQKVGSDMKMATTSDIIGAVSGNEAAIGFAHYYYFQKDGNKDSVRLMNINGVKPNKKNIEKAKYPLTVYSYAIVTMDEATMDLAGVIEMVDKRIEERKAKAAEAAAKAAAEAAAKEGEAKEGEEAAAPPAEAAEPAKQEVPLKLKFIKWILSEKGQNLAEECGFIKHGDPLPEQ